MNYDIRTDLAVETRELYLKSQPNLSKIPGVESFIESPTPHLQITTVTIHTQEGADALKKPIGKYVTLESNYLNDSVKSIDEEIINKLAQVLQKMIKIDSIHSVLVVGLGNKDITPDALGPSVIENLQITRHLIKYAPEILPKGAKAVSAIIPGVLGTTGIETAEIIKGIAEKTKPDAIIVIDALASKNMDRISKTIQISNTGIIPGSGVGNVQFAITEEALGIPVIAIGIPTVVGVPTIVEEAIQYALNKINNQYQKETLQNSHYMKEILESKKFDCMVTPKDIDEMITNLSEIIANGINKALN